ncbi:MAG: dUTP diphosphatase [Candidatus Komeilibacteria bacterium]|nr:dUTP diphosphatase [Candidatus Komeilibacteria bacterium]
MNPAANMPTYANPGDAGLDLYSLEDFELQPGQRNSFFVGFALEIPDGYVGIIKDKSGLPKNFGLHTLGGVFDSCYRGEYNITMVNLGQEAYQIKAGDKIAQLLIIPCQQAELEEVEELSATQRGEGRFGSSGR